MVAPLSPPTSDICHSQSVQQATHLPSVVMLLWRIGLQRGKVRQRELKTEQEGTEGQRQNEREEEGMKEVGRAAASGWFPFRANW